MKERLVTLVCALGALGLFLAMFLHVEDVGNGWGDVSHPTSEERRGNGYRGALVWLGLEHVRAVSFRERFGKLAGQRGLAPTGNLLILTLPASIAFRTEEFRPLDSWVRAGNTLLVLAALSDEPDWAFALGRPVAGDLNLLTGLEFEAVRGVAVRSSRAGAAERGVAGGGAAGKDGDAGKDRSAAKGGDAGERIAASARAFAQPRRGVLVPNGTHAYFEGVGTAVALSDYPSQVWDVKIPFDGFVLSLAREQGTGQGVLWTRPLGDGRVIVSGLASLFTNRALGLADNARLLANIVAATVGPKGAVLFDDMHQGLGAAYDPAKFYSDRRLYETVGILAAFWLCWVLGSTRLQVPVTRATAPREAELVRATGGFLARVLTPDAGARGLFAHFFRRMGERVPSSSGKDDPPWEILEGHPGVSAAELRQLRGWYADALAARRVPLGRLHNLILKIDRHIAA